jgi:hypothetical protein
MAQFSGSMSASLNGCFDGLVKNEWNGSMIPIMLSFGRTGDEAVSASFSRPMVQRSMMTPSCVCLDFLTSKA